MRVDLARVDLVAVDLMRIDLVIPSRYVYIIFIFTLPIFIPIRREYGEKIQTQCASKIRGEKNNETGCFDSTDYHFYRT